MARLTNDQARMEGYLDGIRDAVTCARRVEHHEKANPSGESAAFVAGAIAVALEEQIPQLEALQARGLGMTKRGA